MKKIYISLMLVLASGCGSISSPGDPTTGGQTGEESGGCIQEIRTDLTVTETTPNDVSVDDVLALMGSQSQLTFQWDDGTNAQTTATFSNPRNAIYIEYETKTGEPAIGCDTRVEFLVDYAIESDDGQLDLDGETVIQALSLTEVSTLILFQNATNRGTFRTAPNVSSPYLNFFWLEEPTGEFSGGTIDAETVVFATW